MCKEIKNTDDRCTNEKVQGFHVVAVTNRTLSKRPYLEQIRKICEWGPDAIILREKDLTEKEYKDFAEKVLAICKEYQVPCILHTFYQVAMELPCDGLHLPLPLLREVTAGKSASGRWREKFAKLGTSVHSVEEAIDSEKLGATYITAGHIYATDCKKGLPPRGLLFLREVCEAVDISVYGIGGIKFHMDQWIELGKCGAIGGCIMSGMMEI